MTRMFSRGPGFWELVKHSISSSGSSIRPGPVSPHACGPSAGPSSVMPSARRVAKLRWVVGFCHMDWFIAGARITGADVARQTVLSRSEARPAARRAIKSALAGATTMVSAQRPSSMWPIPDSASGSSRVSRTGRPLSACRVSGAIKAFAAWVIITCTWAPCLHSRRTSSADL